MSKTRATNPAPEVVWQRENFLAPRIHSMPLKAIRVVLSPAVSPQVSPTGLTCKLEAANTLDALGNPIWTNYDVQYIPPEAFADLIVNGRNA